MTIDFVGRGDYEVNVGGARYAVSVSRKAPHDPGNSHTDA
jgi:hypothetical protein